MEYTFGGWAWLKTQSFIPTVIWNLIFLDNIITINKSNKYQDTYSTFTNLL